MRDCEDPFIAIADEATRNTVKAGGPGAMLCDMFPMRKLTFGVGQVSPGAFGVLWTCTFLTYLLYGVSKAPTGVVPVCAVQTPRTVYKGTCLQDV